MTGSIRSRKKYGGHARNPERTPPRLVKLPSVKESVGYAKVPDRRSAARPRQVRVHCRGGA
jgi:hypothetical protein